MKLWPRKTDQELELFDWLEIVRIRVLSGMTLNQATQGAPDLTVSSPLCVLWERLYNRVMESGNLSAAEALQILISRLRLNRDLKNLMAKKLATPRIQSIVITLISVLFFVASGYILPSELKPGLWPTVFAVSLIATAIVWMNLILKNLKKNLWFFEWVIFLSHLESSMSWGMTYRQSFSESFRELDPKQWPKVLYTYLHNYSLTLNSYEESMSDLGSSAKVSLQEKRILEQCRLLFEQSQKGVEIVPTLRHFKEASQNILESEIHRAVEKAQWTLMLPLFTCQMPAFFTILFSPLFKAMSDF